MAYSRDALPEWACGVDSRPRRWPAPGPDLEGEMRLVLKAMDQQKQAAARNMQQLSKIYDDWSHAVNSP